MGLSKRWALIGATVISCLVFFLYEGQQKGFVLSSKEETKSELHSSPSGKASQMGTGLVPDELMGVMYHENDFINDKGIAPTFWECQDANCSAQQPPQYGPCFAPHESVDWNESIDFYKTHPPRYMRMGEGKANTNDLADLCRPGFLIIGAGKCGTRYEFIVYSVSPWLILKICKRFLTSLLLSVHCINTLPHTREFFRPRRNRFITSSTT